MRVKNQGFSRNGIILIYCNGNTTAQQVNSSAEILINKQQYLSESLKYWCKLPPCYSKAPHGCTYSTKCSEIRKCETAAVTNQMEREMHTSTKHLETASVGLAGLRCVTLASDPPLSRGTTLTPPLPPSHTPTQHRSSISHPPLPRMPFLKCLQLQSEGGGGWQWWEVQGWGRQGIRCHFKKSGCQDWLKMEHDFIQLKL